MRNRAAQKSDKNSASLDDILARINMALFLAKRGIQVMSHPLKNC